MSLQPLIFGKPYFIQHPFFGQMRFQGGKKPQPDDFFECSRHFSPSGKNIGLSITADRSGPTEAQVRFYERVEAQYAAITRAALPMIEEAFSEWEPGFRIASFETEFRPDHLEVPAVSTEPVV